MPQQQEPQTSTKALIAAQSASTLVASAPAQSLPQQSYFNPKLYSTFTCTGARLLEPTEICLASCLSTPPFLLQGSISG